MAVGTRMQQRRGLASEWSASNYILAAGEIGIALDSGIAKFGDGVNGWNSLPIAFEDLYLPILGKAADSELLDGVGIESLVKFADTDVDPTADSFVQRDGSGRIKASAGAGTDDVATFGQLNTSRYAVTSRTISGAATLALTDSFSSVYVNNASTTAQIMVTIPPNVDVAFPVGTIIQVVAHNVGGAKILAGAGVSLNGSVYVMPKMGAIRLVKVATNTWDGFSLNAGKTLPTFKIRRTVAGDSYATAYAFVPYDTVDTSETYNPDNEWFSIPGTGMATARRIIINKDGYYDINVNFACNGVGGVTFCQARTMVSDNSATGSQIIGVQSLTAVSSFAVKKRLTAGQSIGVMHGFASGNQGKADAEETGGDPHNLKIVRLSD